MTAHTVSAISSAEKHAKDICTCQISLSGHVDEFFPEEIDFQSRNAQANPVVSPQKLRAFSGLAAGTLVATREGFKAVETLRQGARVLTHDNGYQEVRWAGARRISALEMRNAPEKHPIRIAARTFKKVMPDQDVIVSAGQKFLMCSPENEAQWGASEVFVSARHLLHLGGASRMTPREINYVHLLFDRHETILANGAWVGSFRPDNRALSGFSARQISEIECIFPAAQRAPDTAVFPPARRALNAEAALSISF